MKWRWIWFWLFALLGVVVLACAWVVPAYLRATDLTVVEKAGKNTLTLVDRGLQLIKEDKLGPAELLLEAARFEGIPDRAELGLAVTNLALAHPDWKVWGGGEGHFAVLFGTNSRPRKTLGPPGSSETPSATGVGDEKSRADAESEPLTEWVVRLGNREKVLNLLKASPKPLIQELFRTRTLTNTVIFPAAESSSGQAFDAAIGVCGLLLSEADLNSSLRNALFNAASAANHGGNSQVLEEMLFDFMSLGQRLNWTQLAEFTSQIEEPRTLRLFGERIRKNEEHLPLLFSVVELSRKPAAVAGYLTEYSQTGLDELGTSLRFGEGGLNELLIRKERLYTPGFRQSLAQNTPLGTVSAFALEYVWRSPWVALGIKWLLYLLGGFLFAVAVHFALPPVTALEEPLQVRGFHLAREMLFALGFLLVVLLLSEPFLAQESQKAQFAFRLHLPVVGNADTTGITKAKSSFMDPKSLLTLLLFFVLQALIYSACLIKLAEIRRQRVQPRIKLKLLENEDHLFDAGLYLGFAGTIVSLILVSLGVIKPSLMAAYSSTSFGIIFVSIFKIFHLRPERRKLLLLSEAAEVPPSTNAPSASRPLAAPL
jgi:hypothetical protein